MTNTWMNLQMSSSDACCPFLTTPYLKLTPGWVWPPSSSPSLLKFACLMQTPQNSNEGVLAAPRLQTWASHLSARPFPSPYWVPREGRGGRQRRRVDPGRPRPPLLRPAPRPMRRPSGSSVTITEGHNRAGTFAEPYSRSWPAGARFFQLFWGKDVWVSVRLKGRKIKCKAVELPPPLPPPAQHCWAHMFKPLRESLREPRGSGITGGSWGKRSAPLNLLLCVWVNLCTPEAEVMWLFTALLFKGNLVSPKNQFSAFLFLHFWVCSPQRSNSNLQNAD